jgi:hypothetical protein
VLSILVDLPKFSVGSVRTAVAALHGVCLVETSPAKGESLKEMQGVPEDIIQYKRERKLYKEHLNRIHEAQPMIDSAAPSSLGLKHLETRPKKKQVNPKVYLCVSQLK